MLVKGNIMKNYVWHLSRISGDTMLHKTKEILSKDPTIVTLLLYNLIYIYNKYYKPLF